MDLERYYEAFQIEPAENAGLRLQATLPQILPHGSLLDVGCDGGDWLEFLSKMEMPLTLTGIDISPTSVRKAQDRLKEKAIIHQGSGDHLPFPDDSFDQTTILEVLEHIPQWKDVIMEAIRVTRRRVIITVPYQEHLKTTKCGNCETTAPLYGHVNSFHDSDFLPFAQRKTYISSMNQFYNVGHYARRVVKGIVRKMSRHEDEERNPFKTVCPNCYTTVPYTEYQQRIQARIHKLLWQEPEILMVVIDK